MSENAERSRDVEVLRLVPLRTSCMRRASRRCGWRDTEALDKQSIHTPFHFTALLWRARSARTYFTALVVWMRGTWTHCYDVARFF